MNFSEFRVYLRAFEPDDYETTHRWRQDEKIWATLLGRRYFVSSEFEKKWIHDAIQSNQNSVRVAICLRDEKVHIGNIYLTDIDWIGRNGNLSTVIGEARYRGQGYGREATILLLYHAFYDLGLERVYSRSLVSNQAPVKKNEKLGFKHEGVLRRAVYKNGDYQDVNVMSILRHEFDELMSREEL